MSANQYLKLNHFIQVMDKRLNLDMDIKVHMLHGLEYPNALANMFLIICKMNLEMLKLRISISSKKLA